ncbi:MAG: hypothetical protein IJR98_05640 [Synergistaceae bacterium]|nr:hypothetical protein [Synergistaceae bacterium]
MTYALVKISVKDSQSLTTSDKELGAYNIQTYYVPEYVEQEVNKLNEFFGRTL